MKSEFEDFKAQSDAELARRLEMHDKFKPVEEDKNKRVRRRTGPTRVEWNRANPRLGAEIDEMGYGVIQGNENAFQDWADKNEGNIPVQANYDHLDETQSYWNASNMDMSEESDTLLDAVNSLTEKQQDVWQLCMQEGFSEEEAADKLGVSQQTVHQHKEAAIRKVTAYCQRAVNG